MSASESDGPGRAKAPLGVLIALGLLSLAGSVLVIAWLRAQAKSALEDSLGARLKAAGESAALLFELSGGPGRPLAELVPRLRAAEDLDAAYAVSKSADGRLVADDGSGPRPLDLLRVDPLRLEAALAGRSSVGLGFDLAGLQVLSGYFPMKTPDGAAVLALEAGRPLLMMHRRVDRASLLGVLLSLFSSAILVLVARRWLLAEAVSRRAAERVARGQAIAALAAMAAHEIRNPLGVIRGTVELMQVRSGANLGARDQTALSDVLGEVERLRRLTEDFLDLSTERPIAEGPVDLSAILEESARALEVAQPRISVRREIEAALGLRGDAGRLRQVFLNLLQNAAEADPKGALELHARREGGSAVVVVRDFGRGVLPEVEPHLFDPFFTTRPDGTGLGLAVVRRHVERHGGTIRLLAADGPGAAFEVRLPLDERGGP
jgi:signal transduction histidine kinase